ncbi:MAG: permease prefix domain 1-containing protein [Jatrophihabitans sp.]|uniref:permease prefix domain 1-containing protein n=1 Tax=Jatrophihabitans sp. TaxID=1932789 RepID=UPI0039124EB4
MTGRPSATPIEDYLDELLRRTHADPRTTRRLLDEASDHLAAAAAEVEKAGTPRIEAEREAVRRFGAAADVAQATSRRSFATLVLETVRAAILLGGWGLVAVGISGGVVALMSALFGQRFVGGATILGTGRPDVGEIAHDAVVLRALAGAVGLLLLVGYALFARDRQPAVVLPRGLVDALGAAAFTAAAVGLTGASIDQAVTGGGSSGVGFFLSGALVSLAAAIAFSARATRALLPSR